MSEESSLNEEVKHTKQRFSRILNTTRNKYFNRKVIVPVLILLAIPLTIGLSLVQQESRSRAGGGLPIAMVAINPGIITANIETAKDPIGLSALAYDNQGNAINSGVNYEWSISSTDTVGTLTKTQGIISQLLPYKAGCGMLTVTATYGGQSVTKAAVIQVKDRNFIPKCVTATPSPVPPAGVSWKTNSVVLNADNAYIDLGDTRYLLAGNVSSLVSRPVQLDSDGYYKTTLESTWYPSNNPQGLMRMNMYFRYKPGSFWELIDVFTTDGVNSQNWIPFEHTDEFGQAVQNSLNAPYINTKLNLLLQDTSRKGVIHFDHINLAAFLQGVVGPTPTPSKVTLNPTGDAFVRSSAPTTNFGRTISLQTDTNPTEISYMKFDLSSFKGRTITSATLILKVSSGSSAVQNLRLSDDNSWTETGLKYNNKPIFISTVTSFTPKTAGVIIKLNVITPVNKKKGGAMTLGIVSQANAKAAFYSRESSSANRPQLIIEYK